MTDATTPLAGAGSSTVMPQTAAYAQPQPVAPPQPAAAQTNPAAQTVDQRHAAAANAAPEHGEVVTGFNPSVTIDPDTHIVVMTIRSPDGETLRQIPNQHELAAYKARATDQKKSADRK